LREADLDADTADGLAPVGANVFRKLSAIRTSHELSADCAIDSKPTKREGRSLVLGSRAYD